MTDTPQVGACEAWYAKQAVACTTALEATNFAFMRERDAAFSALERQRDALLAACEAARRQMAIESPADRKVYDQLRAAIAANLRRKRDEPRQ